MVPCGMEADRVTRRAPMTFDATGVGQSDADRPQNSDETVCSSSTEYMLCMKKLVCLV